MEPWVSEQRTTIAADGTLTQQTVGPDPRFGLRAPLLSTTTTAGAQVMTAVASRGATLTTPGDPFSLTSQTDTLLVNGDAWTTHAAKSGGTFTVTRTTPAGRQTVTALDAVGRVSQVTPPGTLPADLLYDARGRLASMAQGPRLWLFDYDAAGNLAAVENPLSEVTAFEYDQASRVTRQTLPDMRQIDFSYDADGNLSQLTPPGRPPHGFDYTQIGLERLYAPPQPEPPLAEPRTFYEYSADRRLEHVVRPGGGTIDHLYDPLSGKLASQVITTADDPPQVLAYGYAYDPATGLLETITAPGGGTLTLEHEGFLPTRATWGGAGPFAGTVTHAYDDHFRIVSEQVNQEPPVTFGYDADGLITSAAMPGGSFTLNRDPLSGRVLSTALGVVEDATTYDAHGDVESYTATANGVPIFTVSYTRDALGRIATRTESVEQEPETTYAYTYDLSGRLTDVHTTTAEGTSHTAHYAYDANGNRVPGGSPGTFTQVSGQLLSATYDEQDRLLEATTGTGGQALYAYTANGELLAKADPSGVTSYGTDALGNLRQVSLPDGTEIEYVIDGRSRRIGRKVDGELTQGLLYRDQLEPVAELDGQGNVASVFVPATREHSPDAMRRSGATYRVLTDHFGSVRLVVDAATGAVAQRRDYDEFGNVLLDTGPGFQPLGFAGGIHDPATGLVRFGVRDFEPATGRWTAKDPIRFDGGDANQFAYVLLDPVSIVDLNGEAPNGWRRLGRALVLLGRLFWGGQGYEPPPPPPGAPPSGASWMPPIPMGLLCSIPGMSSAPECAEYCPEDCCL